MAQYVTYAESIGNDKSLTDCHTVAPRCTAVHYINASRVYSGEDSTGVIAASQENWWLHQPGYSDSAHRLHVTLDGHVGYLLNQSVAGVQRFWQSYVRNHYASYDGLMPDDMSAGLNETLYGTGYSSSNEIRSDAQVVAMHQALTAQLTRSNGTPYFVIENGVNVNPYLPHALQRIGTANVHGLVSEGVPISNGQITNWYPDLLTLMAQVNATSGFIVLLSYGSGGRPSDRYVHTATIWLGYKPGHEVSWENLEGGNDLNVFPEETIYPTQPLQSMSSGNADLLVQGNVWRREFAACYLRGSYWGRCAALVNFNGSAVSVKTSWLNQTYTNTIQVVSGDVQTSGAAVTLGTKQTSIPAKGALLLYGH